MGERRGWIRHANGSVDSSARRDRNGDIEEVRAQRARVARARRGRASKSRCDLGARRERPPGSRGRIEKGRAPTIDDHDAPSGALGVAPRDAREGHRRRRHAVLEVVLRERRERERVDLDPALEIIPLGAPVRDAERDLERREHCDRECEVREEQLASHGGCRRRPTPRTVSIHAGSPSLRRSDATWTSIVFVPPYHVLPQTSSKICCFDTTVPASRARRKRRSNSFGVSSSSLPSSAARRAGPSIVSGPHARRVPVAAKRGAACYCTDPGEQLAEAERLDDVVVGAHLEADDLVHLLTFGSDHDDRDARPRAQLPADGEAVEIGEAEVE